MRYADIVEAFFATNNIDICHKYIFIFAYKDSGASRLNVFQHLWIFVRKELENAKTRYVQSPSTEFHSVRKINVTL